MTFSKDWTDEERLKIVMLLAMVIGRDYSAGQYGAAVAFDETGLPTKFRPNLTSLSGIILASAAELDEAREFIDELAREMFDEQQYKDFYAQPLSEARKEFQAFMGAERPN